MSAAPVFDMLDDPCYNRTMMSTHRKVEVESYRLPLVVERVNGSYQATSPALEGFLVLADSLEEVLALAPGVARALLEAMQAKGVAFPVSLEKVQFPTQVEVLVAA
jgi:predicted RNase H-like HicB family nuclease